MKMSPHGNLGNSVQGEYQDAKSEEKNNPTGSEVSTPKDSSDSCAPENIQHDSYKETNPKGERKVDFADVGWYGSREGEEEHIEASDQGWYFI